MPNIAKVLRDETARIARREANSAVGPATKAARGLKHTVAQLKRRVALLEKEVRSLERTVAGLAKTAPAAARATTEKARITAKGMRSLRRRMDHLFGDFFGPRVLTWEPAELGFALDVYEKDDALVVKAALPGVRPDEVDISVTGDVLTMSKPMVTFTPL